MDGRVAGDYPNLRAAWPGAATEATPSTLARMAASVHVLVLPRSQRGGGGLARRRSRNGRETFALGLRARVLLGRSYLASPRDRCRYGAREGLRLARRLGDDRLDRPAGRRRGCLATFMAGRVDPILEEASLLAARPGTASGWPWCSFSLGTS